MRTIGERIKEQFTFIYKHCKGVRTKFVPLFFDVVGETYQLIDEYGFEIL